MKIFDSIAHPTINGTWLNPRFNNNCNIEQLQEDMARFNIYKAFAVGMDGVGGYSEKGFVDFIKKYPNLIPIAYAQPGFEIEDFSRIKGLGYEGIKIHPRLSGLELDDDRIFNLILNANKVGLSVLYCGFLGVTLKFLRKIENLKFVFLHTGYLECTKTFSALKDFEGILCDFSYTLGCSELEEEIGEIFCNYPHRICVGSDHPELGLGFLRQKFESFTQGLNTGDKERVAFKNLEDFHLLNTGENNV